MLNRIYLEMENAGKEKPVRTNVENEGVEVLEDHEDQEKTYGFIVNLDREGDCGDREEVVCIN